MVLGGMLRWATHQKLTGMPRYAATSAMLSGLKEVFHVPTGLRTLACEGRAAKWRLAAKTSNMFIDLNNMLGEVNKKYGAIR